MPSRYRSSTSTGPPRLEQARRAWSVGLTEQDALLALGIVPVATTKWFGTHPGEIFPWAEKRLGDAELPEVLEDEKQFEKVAALEPDLIVAMYSSITKKDYELLSAIAPTLAHPMVMSTTASRGKRRRAPSARRWARPKKPQMVDAVEDKIDRGRRAPRVPGPRAATVVTIYEGIFVYGPEDPRGRC